MENHRPQDGIEIATIALADVDRGRRDNDSDCVGGYENSLILRRPILDAAETLVGYELKPAGLSAGRPGDPRTSGFVSQLAELLGNLEIARIADQKLIMLAVQGELLQEKVLDHLSCDSLILSVSLPAIVPPQLVGFLKEAWSRGFCIALDNYADTPDQEYLLHAVSYVRIDVSRFNALELARRAADLLEKSGVRLIASNLRSRDDFEACSKLPFDYYQGDFFIERPLRPGVRLDRDRIQVIGLLNKVREKADLVTIERGFRQDPTLVYQLLRYINAPGVGLSREIQSIVQALTVLGYD
ncbi:MAG: HDOD domain-containing protein, partial [Rhodocyclaceae bacterium]